MIAIFKQYFAELLSTETDMSVSEILALIEIPPENISGDLAFPCFQLSKSLKKAPPLIAQDLAKKLSSEYFSSFEAVGGYVNAHINQTSFITQFFTENKKQKSKNIKKIMLEYMNANPNKPLHIGQARNVCIGDSMRRIFIASWCDIQAFNYGDDSGVNVGYNIVGHLHYDYPLEASIKYDHYCGKIYEEMRKKEEDLNFKKLLSTTLQHIESGDPEIHEIHHSYTRKCALEQMKSCRALGASFDAICRETDILHLKFFAEAMDLLREKWFVKFAEEGEAKGCRIIDLSSLPQYAKEEKQYQILIKSDGVATYIGKDISFALWKLGYLKKNFHYDVFAHEPDGNIIYTTTTEENKEHKNKFWNYDTAITVIDNRQIGPQEIVKSSLQLLGYLWAKKQYLPLPYGVVYLTPMTLEKLGYKLTDEEKSEKRLPFSSRKWWTVTLDEMLEMLHQKAYRETKERNPEKDDVRLDMTADKIAVSSLRFFLIRWDINKDIVFDVDEVLNMEGETGAYVLYTGARMQSILDQTTGLPPATQARSRNDSGLGDLLKEDIEFTLVKKLAEFDQIVIKTKNDLAPHLIARYLFELSSLVNSYYAKVKILVEDEPLKYARISLLYKTLEVLKKAMNLIGMQFVERM